MRSLFGGTATMMVSCGEDETTCGGVTVGSCLCPECGEEPVGERRTGWWKRFRYWLVNGSRAPTTLVCQNDHKWWRSFGRLVFRPQHAWLKWVRLPAELFRAVRHGRRIEPTPLTYLMATGVGLLLGFLLDLAFAWAWWAVVGGFVVLVWLVFLSSAFWPGSDIGHSLMRIINQERAARRDRQRLEDAVASGLLAAYEVTGWVGERSIGGWGGASGNPHSITLRHGNFDSAEWVEVTTHTREAADHAGAWHEDDMSDRLAQASFPLPSKPTHEDLRQRQREIRNAPPPEWRPIEIRIDGDQVSGLAARAGRHWVAYFRLSGVLVDLQGAGVGPNELELGPIANLDGYTRTSGP